jgi:hypothetical protein
MPLREGITRVVNQARLATETPGAERRV